MKSKIIAVLILFLIANVCSVWASEYIFSGHGTDFGKKVAGAVDKSRMCTITFSVDESSPSSEVVVTFRFMNTGRSPIKGDLFFSQKVEIISKDGKTYEVSWHSGTSELEEGSGSEIPEKVVPEKVNDVIAHHPELQKSSPLVQPPAYESSESQEETNVQVINPGGAVERVFYNNDPTIRDVIMSQNVDHVIFYSSMGKFVLRLEHGKRAIGA